MGYFIVSINKQLFCNYVTIRKSPSVFPHSAVYWLSFWLACMYSSAVVEVHGIIIITTITIIKTTNK